MMKLKYHHAFVLIAAGLAAAPVAAQVTVSGETSEMPDLNACLAQAEKGDTAAIDACVEANLDEIRTFIDSHPDTETSSPDGDTGEEDQDA